MRELISETQALTGAPFGVNLFVPSEPGDVAADVARYADRIRPEADRLGVELGDAAWDDDDYPAKVDVVVAARPALATFTFGVPSAEDVARLHDAGVSVGVTVTSGAEAVVAVGVGADLVVAQGTEAGGHQGAFLDLRPNGRPLLQLLAELRDTVTVPVMATGGLMDGRDVAAVLEAGAVAAQLGTAFLCTPEAGTSAVHRAALLDGRFADTVITRAFSGRYARGLANQFARHHSEAAPQAYPHLHHLTRPLRAAATAAGDADVPNLWAGTRWRAVRAEPAEEVVRRLAAEWSAAR